MTWTETQLQHLLDHARRQEVKMKRHLPRKVATGQITKREMTNTLLLQEYTVKHFEQALQQHRERRVGKQAALPLE